MRFPRGVVVLSAIAAAATVASLTVAGVASAGPTDASAVASSPTHHAAAGRPQPRLAPALVGSTTIHFDEFPVGTAITDQYADQGVVFSGGTFTSPDGANPTSPVLSGTPRFVGPITGTFVRPSTHAPGTIDGFSLDVGYIDDPGSVHVVVRDADGDQIDELIADSTGIVPLTSTAPGAASFVVETVAGESAGFAIDNLSFDPPVPSLAALGDSYSSGEGNPPFDAASGACHRSPQAWPRLLDTEDEAVDTVAHIACSGARIGALTSGISGEAAQLTQLGAVDPAPDLVTLTIGGNDLGFAEILWDCIWLNCATDGKVAAKRTLLRNTLARRLADTYRAVRSRTSADVIVVGYPRLFPRTPAGGCRLWLADNERTALNDLAAALDSAAATAAATAGVTYVSTLNALNGHELCSASPWVYPIGLNCPFVTLCGHPTLNGQRAIADAVEPVVAAI